MNAPISSPSTTQRQQAFTGSTTSASTSTQSLRHDFAAVAPPPPVAQKTPSTDAFIRDLNLVAEAAKRAQMALLTRDLEGVALS